MPKNKLMSSKVEGHIYQWCSIEHRHKKDIIYASKIISIEEDEDKILIEDECCSIFGCGKILSREEKLFGNKCIKHSK